MSASPSSTISPALQRIHQAAMKLFAEKGAVQLTVSDLALAAGVARGTIYNNLSSTGDLFEQIACQLSNEMNQRILASFDPDDEPALRLAHGIRFFLRRAHEEPDWGRFICRFALSNVSLQDLWTGPPGTELQLGLEQGRYSFRPEQLPSVLALIAGSVLGGMFLVLEGHKTWRDVGSDAVELILRGLGLTPDEARSLATAPLPPLPPLPQID